MADIEPTTIQLKQNRKNHIFHQAQTRTVMVRVSLTAKNLKIRSFNDDKFNF